MRNRLSGRLRGHERRIFCLLSGVKICSFGEEKTGICRLKLFWAVSVMAGFAAGGENIKNRAVPGVGGDFAISESGSVRFIKASMKNGRRVCVKYPLDKKRGAKQRLRKILSALTMQPFLQPLPFIPAAEKNLLEIAKLRDFAAADLAVPEILAVQDGFSIFADTGKTIAEILKELRQRDTILHDRLLIRCAECLGQVHSAGLCHGRPDLRDMFLAERGVGFAGFREYPERFMPMAAAQVRDIWLLLIVIAAKAVDKDFVLAAAFRAWRRQAGLETLESLQAGARFFRLVLKPYKLVSPLIMGKKRQSRLRVLQFLVSNLGV
ncbi:MAG: hypothetical protein DU430_08035 [Candidatus Tokpelaia sp.]|nr:MAG: hypothetical protein DU430_08035 [Candidatus Tokpelaia sp.]